MQVVVLGTGRSGTNIALEMLAGNKYFTPTITIEDKYVFSRGGVIYPDGYLTKSDIEYTPFANIANVMGFNPEMKIIWTIRDPRDIVLSKIYRGRQSEPWAYDASVWGCVGNLQMMFGFFLMLTASYGSRVYVVRMEDILRETDKVARHLCEWLGIDYQESMIYFYKRMREVTKNYTSIDLSEIEKYKRLDTIFNGYFRDKHNEVNSIFSNISHITQFFGYTNDSN